MTSASLNEMYDSVGPPEGTPEHAALSKQMGFGYRSLLGELLYAYVICRPDIGYSLVTLAQFNTNPSKIHYRYLKHVALYLRQTASWGIIYWRQEPNMLLPDVPFDKLEHPTSLPTFPAEINWYKLTGFVDAAYANELRRRRSTTGYGFSLAGGVVSYRCQLQKTHGCQLYRS